MQGFCIKWGLEKSNFVYPNYLKGNNKQPMFVEGRKVNQRQQERYMDTCVCCGGGCGVITLHTEGTYINIIQLARLTEVEEIIERVLALNQLIRQKEKQYSRKNEGIEFDI